MKLSKIKFDKSVNFQYEEIDATLYVLDNQNRTVRSTLIRQTHAIRTNCGTLHRTLPVHKLLLQDKSGTTIICLFVCLLYRYIIPINAQHPLYIIYLSFLFLYFSVSLFIYLFIHPSIHSFYMVTHLPSNSGRTTTIKLYICICLHVCLYFYVYKIKIQQTSKTYYEILSTRHYNVQHTC